jgi:hypothetical protein
MTFIELSAAVHRYFSERNIATGGLTLIFNVSDVPSAAHLDVELCREFSSMVYRASEAGAFDVGSFQAHGINIQVESPIHAPKWEKAE